MTERDKVCSANPSAGKNLKLALNITIVLHGLHVSRLMHRVITSYYKQRTIVGGIIRCLLMDCYCTCAGFIYCFVQICYYANWKKCIDMNRHGSTMNLSSDEVEEHKNEKQFLELTVQWLWWEVVYQYTQIGIWIVENLIVVVVIIIQQKRFRSKPIISYRFA